MFTVVNALSVAVWETDIQFREYYYEVQLSFKAWSKWLLHNWLWFQVLTLTSLWCMTLY